MGLAASARRRMFAGLLALCAMASANQSWAKKGPPPSLVPCPSDIQEMREVLAKRRPAATPAPPAVQLAQQVLPSMGDPRILDLAYDTCRAAAEGKKTYRFDAFRCMGEASARLAQAGTNTEPNFRGAYCALQVAVDLAGRASSPPAKAELAAAHEGSARALVALAELSPASADSYSSAAVREYDNALRLEATPERHFELGQLYLTRDEPGKAEQQITKGASLAPKGSYTAGMLVDLAEVQVARGSSPEQVLEILTLAQKADAESVAVNGAMGIALFELDRAEEARAAFEKVVKTAPQEDEAGTTARNYRAEAHYHLALLDARTAKSRASWKAVAQTAQRAIQAGGGDFRFRRLLCLSQIAHGAAAEAGGWCQGSNTPEGQLLQGIYHLAQSQTVPSFVVRRNPTANEQRYREFVGQAKAAFANAANDGGTLSWPGLEAGPSMQDTVAFAEQLIEYRNDFCRNSRLLRPAEGNDTAGARALFERYNVLECRR